MTGERRGVNAVAANGIGGSAKLDEKRTMGPMGPRRLGRRE